MKKYIFLFLAVCAMTGAFAQVTLRIDSVDFSRTSERLRADLNRVKGEVGDSIHPRMRIVATIQNHSEKQICVYNPLFEQNGKIKLRFKNHGKIYYQDLGWKSRRVSPQEAMVGKSLIPKNFLPDIGLFIEPGKSEHMELWAFFPSEKSSNQEFFGNLFEIYPPWISEGKFESNEDYLVWFRNVLFDMKIIVGYSYGSRLPWDMHEVVSDPIDFEKLFVTTNLTNRAVIDTALIEALRTLKEYYTPAFPEEGGRFVQPNVEALEERNRMEIQVDDAAQCVRKWMLGK